LWEILLAGFQGLYHLFGARVTSWDITDEGIVANGVTFASPYDPNQIVEDINKHNRRVEFLPAYRVVVQGQEPEPFEDAGAVNRWGVQYFKGAGTDSKAPAYLREASASYKATAGILGKRGPKRRTIRLDKMEDLTEETLKNIPAENIQKLREMLADLDKNSVTTAA